MASCRSCGAPVVWAVTHTGRTMPIDPEPREDGNLVKVGEVVFHGSTSPRVEVLPKEQEPLLAEERYVSHFATCPNADEHRRT